MALNSAAWLCSSLHNVLAYAAWPAVAACQCLAPACLQIAQIHAVKMRELRPGSGYGQAGGAMERAASLGAPAGWVGGQGDRWALHASWLLAGAAGACWRCWKMSGHVPAAHLQAAPLIQRLCCVGYAPAAPLPFWRTRGGGQRGCKTRFARSGSTPSATAAATATGRALALRQAQLRRVDAIQLLLFAVCCLQWCLRSARLVSPVDLLMPAAVLCSQLGWWARRGKLPPPHAAAGPSCPVAVRSRGGAPPACGAQHRACCRGEWLGGRPMSSCTCCCHCAWWAAPYPALGLLACRRKPGGSLAGMPDQPPPKLASSSSSPRAIRRVLAVCRLLPRQRATSGLMLRRNQLSLLSLASPAAAATASMTAAAQGRPSVHRIRWIWGWTGAAAVHSWGRGRQPLAFLCPAGSPALQRAASASLPR